MMVKAKAVAAIVLIVFVVCNFETGMAFVVSVEKVERR